MALVRSNPRQSSLQALGNFVGGMARDYYPLARYYQPLRGAVRKLATAKSHRDRSHRSQQGNVDTERGKVNSGQGVSNNYDKTLIYRKKRQTKRAKDWIQFKKKVLNAQLGTVAPNNIRMEKLFDLPWATNSQALSSSQLLSMNGIANFDDDMNRIRTNLFASTTSGSWYIDNCVMDLIITNISGLEAVPTEATTVLIEMYRWKAVRDSQKGNFGIQWVDQLDEADTNTSKPTVNSYGQTPFDAPGLGKYFRIFKKTEHLLPQGQSFTYQVRDHENHKINEHYINDFTGFSKANLTHGVLIVARGVPTPTVNYPSGAIKVSSVSQYRLRNIEERTAFVDDL